jgi:hypothetical protein
MLKPPKRMVLCSMRCHWEVSVPVCCCFGCERSCIWDADCFANNPRALAGLLAQHAGAPLLLRSGQDARSPMRLSSPPPSRQVTPPSSLTTLPKVAPTAPSLIPTLYGNTVRSFSTHGQQSAAKGSSTTVSRSDIRLIQHLDSSALGLVRRWRLIGYFPIHLLPPLLPSDAGRAAAAHGVQIGSGPDAAYVGMVLDGHGLMGERCAEVCGTALLDHLKFALHPCTDDQVKVRNALVASLFNTLTLTRTGLGAGSSLAFSLTLRTLPGRDGSLFVQGRGLLVAAQVVLQSAFRCAHFAGLDLYKELPTEYNYPQVAPPSNNRNALGVARAMRQRSPPLRPPLA